MEYLGSPQDFIMLTRYGEDMTAKEFITDPAIARDDRQVQRLARSEECDGGEEGGC